MGSHLLLSKLVLLLSASWSVAEPTVTVSGLLKHTDQDDGKVVSVAGAITAYRERVSAKGNPCTTFRLEDGGSSVSAFSWKHQGLENGLRVRMTGTFAVPKHVGSISSTMKLRHSKYRCSSRVHVVHKVEPACVETMFNELSSALIF